MSPRPAIAAPPIVPDPASQRPEQVTVTLLRNEDSFRRMVESIRDYAVFMLDTEGRVATWNEGARRFKGYEPHEIIGQYFSVFYEEEARRRGRPQFLLRLAEKDGRVEDEGWRVRKDGTRFWADVVITALRDDHGQLIGYAKVTRDLTERREAEERLRQSEERFRLLLQSVRDYAIFMLDPQGRVATWNEGAERLKGYRADEIIGQKFDRFLTPEDVAAGKPGRELECAVRDGRFEDEGWRVRKDGSRFWANVVLTPIYDSAHRLVGFSKVTRDLTDRREREQERVRAAQAEEAVRLRDEFLSIASHELRTPLTALQIQLQSMQERVTATADEKLGRKLTRAVESALRLNDLIKMLMDVSRISTGRFDLHTEELDLSLAVLSVVERMQEVAAQAQSPLSFACEGPVVGVWDRLRMEQVLTNLLSNAVRYGAGGPIEVALSSRGGMATLTVTDHGPGIPEQDLERIFGRFERASSIRNFGGMGLGLYVSRQITAAHGGTIKAENVDGGGARFTVEVPVRTKAGGAAT